MVERATLNVLEREGRTSVLETFKRFRKPILNGAPERVL
jgi:hypothetical protein